MMIIHQDSDAMAELIKFTTVNFRALVIIIITIIILFFIPETIIVIYSI